MTTRALSRLSIVMPCRRVSQPKPPPSVRPATPLGINSTTGVAGRTLGGGFGWLTRLHGLTIDNLLSARVVMADGSVRTASAREEPELFWALRGGGGNFGIVTSFEFALHPTGPEVYAGFVVYPFAQARQVLRAWRDFCATAPETVQPR